LTKPYLVVVPESVPLNTLLSRASTAFTWEYEQRLAVAGYADISIAAATNVLRFLDDEAVRVGSLVERSGVTKQAISQQVAHLVARGYVHLEPEEADSRAKRVRLTDKGRRCQDVTRPLHETVEREWRRRFGREDIGRLRTGLEHIVDRLAAGD
jgi:DNA-binding MarR family transcriptional regulator